MKILKLLKVFVVANKIESKAMSQPICHSGLSGIILCFQKDSRRALLAGMTACEALLMTFLVSL